MRIIYFTLKRKLISIGIQSFPINIIIRIKILQIYLISKVCIQINAEYKLWLDYKIWNYYLMLQIKCKTCKMADAIGVLSFVFLYTFTIDASSPFAVVETYIIIEEWILISTNLKPFMCCELAQQRVIYAARFVWVNIIVSCSI